jgi:hypothetical protein
MAIISLAVFCGSKDGIDDVYVNHARELVELMATLFLMIARAKEKNV